MQSSRPRLTPAIANVRAAARASLIGLAATLFPTDSGNSGIGAQIARKITLNGALPAPIPEFPELRSAESTTGPLILVALSGGPDSLALAAAAAFEGPRAGFAVGAVVIDHGLQAGSADVAAHAAAQATALGLAPVLVRTVTVGKRGGPEAAARTARYAALEQVATETGACAVLLGHTLDDQAETVLLGLARGSGATSLHGMAANVGLYARPLLGIRRATTVQFCVDCGLEPWIDPQNSDERFSRVRIRESVLPVLESELGPGVAEALVRTAALLREDTEALDHFAEELIEELAEIADAGISLPVAALAANPAALRQRLIRLAVAGEFHVALSRVQTLEVARLVTDWHGQSAIDLPGVRVERRGSLLHFSAHEKSK